MHCIQGLDETSHLIATFSGLLCVFCYRSLMESNSVQQWGICKFAFFLLLGPLAYLKLFEHVDKQLDLKQFDAAL